MQPNPLSERLRTMTDETDTEIEETDEEHDERAEEAMRARVNEAAAQSGEIAGRLFRAFNLWETGREHKRNESKRCGELLAARIAQFNEAMQVGHSTVNDQVTKLLVVEQRWQDLEDARAEKKLVASACKDAIKSAEQKIKELMVEAKSTQLGLKFSSEAEDASDGAGE